MPNPQLQLAQALIRGTDLCVFLTGKAGTGKTTFLHALRADLPKRMIVTAPTGVAAINAGGVTLHSFFQLPFGPFVPGGDSERQAAERRFSRQKREIVQGLDLLVIDEISMVRCDLLDAVDFVLRRERRSDRPFGGVQLLMIGDLHQLAPVVPGQDWAILRDFYDSAYFFGSRALQATEVVPIALEHIYRQSDADVHRAAQSRARQSAGRRDPGAVEFPLSARFPARGVGGLYHPDDAQPGRRSHQRDAPQRTRHQGIRIRREYPGRLPGAQLSDRRDADLETRRPGHVRAQRSRTGRKRYFNGKIGTVTHLGRERIVVRCPGDEDAIEVEPVTWENIQYSLDKETKAISEEVIGTFTQYPLRLAWAITIHKSQGLTFERAIVDAGAAFSHGQVYVALSRCKTFEGLVLGAPIPRRAVMTDRVVSDYVAEATRHPPTQDRIDRARIDYQQRLLLECWDFDALGARLRRLLGLLRDNRRVVDANGLDAIDALERQTLDGVVAVAAKFRGQLRSLFREDLTPEDDERVQERLRKASAYFSEKLQQGLRPWLDAFSFGTDNKTLRKTLRQAVEELRKELTVKTAGLASCREGFSTATHLGALAKARIDSESGGPPTGQGFDPRPGDAEGPGLLGALRRWRDNKAQGEEREGVARYRVLTRAVLRQIADTLPQDPEALAAVKGIGKRTVERYGPEILGVVSDWCRNQGIDPAAVPRPGKPCKTEADASEGSTRLVSYRLYQEGLSIDDSRLSRFAHAVVFHRRGRWPPAVSRGAPAVGERPLRR